ncbi:MAG: hypothetical protein H0V35_15520 [Nitrospira sp.]|nr:hypothetical protein [Nitrospira sp.]
MRRPARSAAAFLSSKLTITNLWEASASCTGCELYKQAPQTVFGEGPAEVQVLEPRVVLCLGVTAAQSVFDKAVRLNELRGRPFSTPFA